MKGTIDLERKGIILAGQPLLLSTPLSTSTNPLACCMPTSTKTSSFNSTSTNNFLPFLNILWAEETSSGKPNEIEISYVYPIDPTPPIKNSSTFELPYEDGKRKLYPATQILTIESPDFNPVDNNLNLSDFIMSQAYPNSEKFKPQSIYVIINPHSGKGKANDIFNEQVKPILISAHCNLTVQHTEYQSHATDLARSLNIDDYDTILCASGDGIPYEVINGFYQRSDKVRAFSKINVVQTPGGSGNALSLSCLGATSASLAALRILKGKPSQCDLMAVSKESSDEITLSFLSQTYGAIAQADIGTEWMRSVGVVRFDLGVAYEVLAGKKYPCDLAVKWKCKDNEEIHKHLKNENSKPSVGLKELTDADFILKYNDQFQHSKSFNNLPDGWSIYDKNITENSRIFYAGKMPYIASTTNFFPAALPNDGAIDIIVFDSRSNLLATANALLSLDKGTHVWEDCVKHSKVEAFRLIPRSKKECYISVDGEWFPYETFQVEILSGILRTILWADDAFTEAGYLANAA